MEITVNELGKGKRLDVFLVKHLSNAVVTRSVVEQLIKEGLLVNGKQVKKSMKLKVGDKLAVDGDVLKRIIEGNSRDSGVSEVTAGEQGELKIVEETDDWLVLNKQKGIVIHPGVNNHSGTLANFVVGYLQSKGEYDAAVKRGGVVHRLDKGVSGLVIFAKNRGTQLHLKRQFESREVSKIYLAKVKKFKDTAFSKQIDSMNGELKASTEVDKYLKSGIGPEWIEIEGTIDRDSANRMRMKFSTGARSGRYSSLYIKALSKSEFLIVLKTGRMHQIRATLHNLGFVISGDRLYGDSGADNSDKIALESILLSLKDRVGERREWRLI